MSGIATPHEWAYAPVAGCTRHRVGPSAPGQGTVMRDGGQAAGSRGLGRCGCMPAKEARHGRSATRSRSNTLAAGSFKRAERTGFGTISELCSLRLGRCDVAGARVADAAFSIVLKAT